MPTDPFALLDLNVLIALSWPRHVHHARAHQWFADRGDEPWATTSITEAGFLRLSTNAAVVGREVPMTEALAALRALRALPGHRFVEDAATLAVPVVDLSRLVTGRQVTDVHLVNLAALAGGVIATLDASIPTYLEPGDRRHVRLVP